MRTVNIVVDASRPVRESVRVEACGENRYRLLQSPGLAQNLAADDVFDLATDGTFTVVERGGNLCIQVFAPAPFIAALERWATEELAKLGGRRDGLGDKLVVYTVPVSAGFTQIEEVLGRLVDRFPQAQWYYGNVYDPVDGVTPLGWW